MRRVVLLGCAAVAIGCGSPESATTGDKRDSTTVPSGFRVSDEQRGRLEIITLAPSEFRSNVEATGTVAFNGDRSTVVISPISGPVTRLVATLGTVVAPGQALAMVSSPDFAMAVADYRKADAAARNTKRIRDLDEQLFANDALARTDLDQARTDASSAAADLDAAEQQLRSLGIDAKTIAAIRDGQSAGALEGAVRAPIAGTVVEQLINPGQILAAGATPAFTVADLSTMWVLANIYGGDVGLIRKGDAVDVLTDQSTVPVTGRVDFIAPIVDPGTRATTVRILATNGSRVLKRDLFVQVKIHTARTRTGLVVPASSVLRDDDNLPFVFIANSDKTFTRRRVTIGVAVADGYEITEGLKAGEQVLANGALFVQFAEHQ